VTVSRDRAPRSFVSRANSCIPLCATASFGVVRPTRRSFCGVHSALAMARAGHGPDTAAALAMARARIPPPPPAETPPPKAVRAREQSTGGSCLSDGRRDAADSCFVPMMPTIPRRVDLALHDGLIVLFAACRGTACRSVPGQLWQHAGTRAHCAGAHAHARCIAATRRKNVSVCTLFAVGVCM
jgi:hypothetical protein